MRRVHRATDSVRGPHRQDKAQGVWRLFRRQDEPRRVHQGRIFQRPPQEKQQPQLGQKEERCCCGCCGLRCVVVIFDDVQFVFVADQDEGRGWRVAAAVEGATKKPRRWRTRHRG